MRSVGLYTGEVSHRTQRDNTSKLQCGHRDTGETMRTGTITRADTNMEVGIEADVAESLWAYEQWRFSIVACAAYVLALQPTF